jgi:radical SAM superfamily enzyme YgiQ (UPF0313 family)
MQARMSRQQIADLNRILGRERGTIHKDWGGRLPIALAFPNIYYLGMSSLALHSLYGLWNARQDVVCERVFFTPPSRGMRQRGAASPISLESNSPLDYFPVIAFSVSYELDYLNLVQLLRDAGIPALAADRDESHPLLIAGGPALSANPEPLALILDAIVIGEVEPILVPLTDALQLIAEDRDRALRALSKIPGLYLPNYGPRSPDQKAVARQVLGDLDAFPTHSIILTPDTEFADMGLIEIARGCGRGCRFCLAGYTYRPARQRSVESILAQSRRLLNDTERIGLVSAAVSDHRQIDLLAVQLRELGARISVSSMRVDPVSEPLIRALAESGTRTLTIAPEAGSQRLREVINKAQTEEHVIRATELAARYSFEQIKLYFMVGLPTETEDDVAGLVDLALECAGRFSRQVIVNLTPFVPKAHTPFQRLAQTPSKTMKRRIGYVEKNLRSQGIVVKSESPAWAEIQGALARGDRRLTQAILATDRLTPSAWRHTLRKSDLSLEELLGQRADEILPWAMIQSSVPPEYLDREAARSGVPEPLSPAHND